MAEEDDTVTFTIDTELPINEPDVETAGGTPIVYNYSYGYYGFTMPAANVTVTVNLEE